MSREIRTITVELRAQDDDGRRIGGKAARFNSLSEDLYFFHEIISPGAFARTIERDDIRSLWNHESKYLLGRNQNGTLELSEDSEGLEFVAVLPETTYADDVLALVRRGDLTQMSFGFSVIGERWPERKDWPEGIDYEAAGVQTLRVLTEVKLYEVSPVTFPAYPETSVEAREYIDGLNQARGLADKSRAQGRRRELAKRQLHLLKFKG